MRGADGRRSAHIDVCPHRPVSFSCGGQPPLVKGSVVRCPYHFQEFDSRAAAWPPSTAKPARPSTW
ncbi:Rieske 2Fe-2S domain-containing protein [Microcystis elabens FACHB-917]|nr:Rieske 2Fe-2S domain-containing protein [Microcystis elabens FACHB-917]